MARKIEIKNGEILFNQGDTDDRVLKIAAGEVEVLREFAWI